MKKRIGKKAALILGLFMTVIVTSGCGNNKAEAIRKLTVGTIGEMPEVQKQADEFNRTHEDVQIEVKAYKSDSVSGMRSVDVAKMEIAAGKGTDILIFDSWFSKSDIAGGMLKDLSTYMEADEEFDKGKYYTNILDAYKLENKQYVLPVSFQISTFAGKAELLGQGKNWTMEQFAKCFLEKKEGMTLFPGDTKIAVFGWLCTGSLDSFIDWGSAQCFFDSEAFVHMLEFSNQFPAKFIYDEELSVQKEFRENRALLYPVNISDVYQVSLTNCLFEREEINYIGYPSVAGNGSIIKSASYVLGITENCTEDEAAWQFIKMFFEEDYQRKIQDSIPVLKTALEAWIEEAKTTEYDENGEAKRKAESLFEGGDALWVTEISEEEAEQLRNIIQNAEMLSTVDTELYDIVLEEAAVYFEGDRRAEETADIIQNRVKIYVGERVQ